MLRAKDILRLLKNPIPRDCRSHKFEDIADPCPKCLPGTPCREHWEVLHARFTPEDLEFERDEMDREAFMDLERRSGR